MPVDLRFSVPAVVVATTCAFAVIVRAATVAAPPPKPHATAAQKKQIAQAVEASEKDWTRETTENFPSDDWSQRDDFGGREYRKLEELSEQHGVRLEDVLRAVDDDLHAHAVRAPDAPDVRAARAVPCKPRPFYD